MAVTWNTLDKSANITLSGGSLTAASTSATQGAVRATLSAAAGKVIFSSVMRVQAGSATAVGWANATAALGSVLGIDANSVGVRTTDGVVRFNNATIGTLYACVANAVVEFALDITNKNVWVRINHGFWNNSVTANPATNTGGFSVAAIAAGPYFPIFASNSSGDQTTTQFGALEPIYDIPSGFSTLDTAVQLYEAVASFKGYAVTSGFQNAVTLASFKGYAVSGGFQNAISIAKLLGYVVVQQFPFGINQEFNLPRLRPKINQRPGTSFSPDQSAFVAFSQFGTSFELPLRRSPRRQDFMFSPAFFTQQTAPQFAYLLLASI